MSFKYLNILNKYCSYAYHLFCISAWTYNFTKKIKINVILLFGNSMFCTPHKTTQKLFFIPSVRNMCVYFWTIFFLFGDSNIYSNNPTAVNKGPHLKLHYVNTFDL